MSSFSRLTALFDLRGTPRSAVALLQLLLALVLLAACALSVSAAERLVFYWTPLETVRLYDDSGWDLSVDRAVSRWNSSGLQVRFELVDSPEQADIIVRDSDNFESRRGCHGESTIGCATVGYQRFAPRGEAGFIDLRTRPAGEADRGQFADVMAHEMGHVLGLSHSHTECSLMNNNRWCAPEKDQQVRYQSACPFSLDPSYGEKDRCESANVVTALCGPTQDEIKRLSDAYGYKPPARDYSPYCKRSEPKPWTGWCVFPAYLPAGYERPGFLTFYKGRWRCGPSTPISLLTHRDQIQMDLNVRRLRAVIWTAQVGRDRHRAYMRSEGARQLERIRRIGRQLRASRPVVSFACGRSLRCQRRTELSELARVRVGAPQHAEVYAQVAASRRDTTGLLLLKRIKAQRARDHNRARHVADASGQ